MPLRRGGDPQPPTPNLNYNPNPNPNPSLNPNPNPDPNPNQAADLNDQLMLIIESQPRGDVPRSAKMENGLRRPTRDGTLFGAAVRCQLDPTPKPQPLPQSQPLTLTLTPTP